MSIQIKFALLLYKRIFSFVVFFSLLRSTMSKPVQRKKQPEVVSKTEPKKQELNPKTTHYEFGGPIGAVGMVVCLPILVLFFATCCDATGYPSQAFRDDWKSAVLSKLSIDFIYSLFDFSAFVVYTGFVALLALFYIILPGNVSPGTQLRDGSRIRYRLNGIISFYCYLLTYIFLF
jgi:hypothetical protein